MKSLQYMSVRSIVPFSIAALAASGLLFPTQTARADNTPGSLISLINGGTTLRDLFTISADGKTVEVNGDHLGNSTWTISGGIGGQLIGIRRLFMVDVSGTPNPKPGPAATGVAGQGFVQPSKGSGTKVNWVLRTENSYVGWDSGDGGSGFPTGGKWLTVGNPSLAGKAGKTIEDFGSFKFVSSLFDTSGKLKYDIGIDYLTTAGTARGYFPQTLVPEPIFYQLGALLGLGGIGVIRMRRKAG